MKANPGGIVSPDEVIGRDHLIGRLWATLERQSLVLVAERRMGKTAIIKKMAVEPPPEMRALYMDLEGISRVNEFVERLAQDIRVYLSASHRATKWLNDLWSGLGGLEVAGILKLPQSERPHWKTALERLLAGLASDAGQRTVLIWDEFPWMLQRIKRTEGEPVVVDLLDLLRAMRQTHADVRLVYTGSIGLHHVLNSLRDEGYANSPLNDMRTVEVPPLDRAAATRLAEALLQGEGLLTGARDQGADPGPDQTPVQQSAPVAERIAELVDQVPYYIHHVIASLADAGQTATPAAVDAMVARGLAEPQDPWHLEHYRARLPDYYQTRAGVARALLTILAETQPLGLDDLHERLRTDCRPDNDRARALVEGDREPLRALVKLMQRDHYLAQQTDGGYRFRFDLIRRWWRLDLGLGPDPDLDLDSDLNPNLDGTSI